VNRSSAMLWRIASNDDGTGGGMNSDGEVQ
jgi:hypothetical protein